MYFFQEFVFILFSIVFLFSCIHLSGRWLPWPLQRIILKSVGRCHWQYHSEQNAYCKEFKHVCIHTVVFFLFFFSNQLFTCNSFMQFQRSILVFYQQFCVKSIDITCVKKFIDSTVLLKAHSNCKWSAINIDQALFSQLLIVSMCIIACFVLNVLQQKVFLLFLLMLSFFSRKSLGLNFQILSSEFEFHRIHSFLFITF